MQHPWLCLYFIKPAKSCRCLKTTDCHHHEEGRRICHTLHRSDPEPSCALQLHHTVARRPVWNTEPALQEHSWRVLSTVWRRRELHPKTVLGINWLLLVCWCHQWAADPRHKHPTRKETWLRWVMMCVTLLHGTRLCFSLVFDGRFVSVKTAPSFFNRFGEK